MLDSVLPSLLSHIDFHTYWTVFLFGLLISTTAMSTGIDGAIFWAPVLLLVYKVDPAVAIACAIGIEIFGFGSGVYGFAKKGKIMFKKAARLLVLAAPLGIAGAIVSKLLPSPILIGLMGLSCVFLGIANYRRAKVSFFEKGIQYPLHEFKLGAFLTALGGFATGAIGVGIGEASHYYLFIRNRYPVAYSTGTAVFIVAVTAFTSSIFNFFYFRSTGSAMDLYTILNVLVFAVPAVMIGARIGVLLAHKILRKHFNYMLSVICTFVALLSFYRVYISVEHEQMLALLASLIP